MLDLANPHTINEGIKLFFALIIGHALADYPLQGDFLAMHKNRNYRDPVRPLPEGLWLHCLFAHSLIHAGCVWLITGRIVLAFAELVVHLILDFIKGEGVTGLHTDQALHVLTKIIFVVAIVQHWVA